MRLSVFIYSSTPKMRHPNVSGVFGPMDDRKRVDMPGNIEFGKRIQELRKRKMETDPSFSLRQFAAKVGISPTFVSKIENGEFDPPSAENIKKMAALLECNADELLALAGKVDPDIAEIIRKKPKALADFLRVAHGRSEEEIRKMTARMVNPEEKGDAEKQ